MAITAVELNYIIFRYLQDTGLSHSAFMFHFEAGVDMSLGDTHVVPRTALVTLVQKGLQYIEMEANMITELNDMDADFVIFPAMELVTKNVSDLQKNAADRRNNPQLAEASNLDKQKEGGSSHVKDKARKGRGKQDKGMEGKQEIQWGSKRSRKYLR